MHDPRLRRLILIGYTKLAIIVIGVGVFLMPMAIHSGAAGMRITLIACGICAIGLAVAQATITREWMCLFSGTIIVGALIVFGTAYFLTVNDTLKQVGIILILGIMWYGLPKIAEYESRRPR